MLSLSEDIYNSCWSQVVQDGLQQQSELHLDPDDSQMAMQLQSGASIAPCSLRWKHSSSCVNTDIKVPLFATFNWMLTSGAMMRWINSAQHPERQSALEEQMCTHNKEWRLRALDGNQGTVANLFLNQMMEQFFAPLFNMAVPWLWKQSLSCTTTYLREFRLLKAHSWIMYCAPTDGKLCIAGTSRHDRRMDDMRIKVLQLGGVFVTEGRG